MGSIKTLVVVLLNVGIDAAAENCQNVYWTHHILDRFC